MSGPIPVPVQVAATRTHGTLNPLTNPTYLSSSMIGSGHLGSDLMTRITMSLKSGLDSEIEWATTSLAQQSFLAADTISFEKNGFLGHQLIKYCTKPFLLIVDEAYDKVTDEMVNLSLNSLLALRNSMQDLANQQWLSQVKGFKKNVMEVLRFLNEWFFSDKPQPVQLQRFEVQFTEALAHFLDVVEQLSCYYVDNTKNDQLFNVVLNIAYTASDKFLVVGALNALTHLLYTSPDDRKDDAYDLTKTPNNCINAIKPAHLAKWANYLLLNDNRLVVAVLELFTQYLFSRALSAAAPQSLAASQLYRLDQLLQLTASQNGLNTLLKQLPVLLLAGLPLTDPSQVPMPEAEQLSKRTGHSSVPTDAPSLPKQLYDIIVKFPEPLRATIWLRCCYEPFNVPPRDADADESSQPTVGEVTQISLWKAYEKQFEQVWQNAKNNPTPDWPSLLPAVDFIKNVSSAFPNSEAMVVLLDADAEKPKKKFIIRGIQPRQFVVNIDVGNYDALKRKPAASSPSPEESADDLPLGHVDRDQFHHNLSAITSALTYDRDYHKLVNRINLLAKDLLDYTLKHLGQFEDAPYYFSVFRLYNKHWLTELIYANPSLVQCGLIDETWVKHLI